MKNFFAIALSLVPCLATAATFESVVNKITSLLQPIVNIIVAIGLVTFLWGVVNYITAGDDPKKRTAAKDYMIYGIIGLAVMVSVWALVNILVNTFGLKGSGTITVPQIR